MEFHEDLKSYSIDFYRLTFNFNFNCKVVGIELALLSLLNIDASNT